MFDWHEEWQFCLQQEDEDSWVVKAEGSLILEGNLSLVTVFLVKTSQYHPL